MRRTINVSALESYSPAVFRRLRSRLEKGRLKKIVFDCADALLLQEKSLRRLRRLTGVEKGQSHVWLVGVTPELHIILKMTGFSGQVREAASLECSKEVIDELRVIAAAGGDYDGPKLARSR